VANESALFDEPFAKRFQFIASNLSLDFCNSVGGKREGIRRENLHSYPHFVSWCEQAGLLNQGQVQDLYRHFIEAPDRGAAVLARALALREANYRIFFAVAGGDQPSGVDIDVLNSELALSLGRLRIGPSSEIRAFSWNWADAPIELDHGLGPIAYSAAGLLASGQQLTRVRQCQGDNCGWLFLDLSKNHSRCWCDMRDCGNRAKVRRHRRKLRDAGSAQ
jgi:predicted RNA-binding Zn ribbon-like protein